MKNIFNKIYSFFYFSLLNLFNRNSPKVLLLEDRYDVGHKNDDASNCVIKIKDTETGERLKNVLEDILRQPITFYLSEKTTFLLQIKKLVINSSGTVEWFKFKVFGYEDYFIYGLNIDIVQFYAAFISSMEARGFVIDSSKFEYRDYTDIVEFLALFVKVDDSEKNERFKENRILFTKYAHFLMSGQNDFEDVYSKFSAESLNNSDDLPYEFSIFRICYQAFNGRIPNSYDCFCSLISIDEDYFEFSNNFDFRSTKSITEETDTYIIYDNSIKIYKPLTREMYRFFNKVKNSSIAIFCNEEIVNFIFDLDCECVGFRVKYREKKNSNAIANYPTLFKEIDVTKLANIYELFYRIRDVYSFFAKITYYMSFNDFAGSTLINDFNLEEDLQLVFLKDETECSFASVDEMARFFKNVQYSIDQVLSCFWDKCFEYFATKYPGIISKKDLYAKTEIRTLRPGIASNIFKAVSTGKKVLNMSFANSFKAFLGELSGIYPDFITFKDPSMDQKLDFYFVDELEEKIGVTVEEDARLDKVIADNRKLVIFEKPVNLKEFEQELDYKVEDLKKIPWLKRKIKAKEINLILPEVWIFSKNKVKKDKYMLIGYITVPYSRTELKDEILLGLDNRKLCTWIGKFYSTFYANDVPNECVFVDVDKDEFFIDILSTRFKIYSTGFHDPAKYLENFFERLRSIGYNEYGIYSLEQVLVNAQGSFCDFLKVAKSWNKYCNKHNIFHSGRYCPICSQTMFHVDKEHRKKYYEDEYATHYLIPHTTRVLKIYKPSVVVQKIEPYIDRALCDKTLGKSFFGIQDCFVPIMKAFDDDEKFIGIVYERENLKDLNSQDSCIDLEDLRTMNNRPRIKSLIRLLNQVNELVQNGWGFIINPFGKVYLNKAHKKQVQIFNVDFLVFGICACQNAIHWTCEYVRKVIEEDDAIEGKEITGGDVKSLLYSLIRYESNLTNYCSYHNIYYDKKHFCCPKCVPPEKLKKMPIEYLDENVVKSYRKINEGGESIIYEYYNGYVTKVFKDGVDLSLKLKIMMALLEKIDTIQKVDDMNDSFEYAEPIKLLVTNEGKLIGCVMRRVSGDPISCLRDKTYVERHGYTLKDILEILIAASTGIDELHEKLGIYIGDLNGRNILLDNKKVVTFIDFDGMGVDGVKPVFCTDGYIDPESKKSQNITMKDDWYSFAIQIFYYLTYTHPFNGIYRERGKMLDQIEMMEKKISLLGNHNIGVPKIAKDWEWMTPELKKALLDTFEGSRRESFTRLLIEQYNILFMPRDVQFTKKSESLFRINERFVASAIELFDVRDFKYTIKSGCVGIQVLQNEIKFVGNRLKEGTLNNSLNYFTTTRTRSLSDISNVIFADDGDFAFLVFQHGIEVYGNPDKDGKLTYESRMDFPENTCYMIEGNYIYYVTIYNGDSVIVKTAIKTGNIEGRFKLMNNYTVKDFYVLDDRKFMIVYQNPLNGYVGIYGNGVLCYEFEKKFDINSEFGILYDKDTRIWTILSNAGDVVIIDNKGKAVEQKLTNWDHVENISLIRGKLYMVSSGKIEIYDVKSFTYKRINCNPKLITNDSEVVGVNSRGFDVVTKNILYEVRLIG